MPRPTRIQYENAYYHVMNRGKARQTIFHGEIYYQAFLQTLDEAHKRFDAYTHAYCLMGNHYHLLIETPRANLDRIMRHINGIYTQRYNRLRRMDGPLFRSRYKAIIVDADDYLLPLSRYIHRNPIEVKGVTADKLDSYSWSSYHAYINQAKAPEWLYREATHSALGAKQRYVAYKAYVGQGIDEDIGRFYNKGNVATILGDKSFKTYIAENRESMHISGDLSRIVTDKPNGAAIVDAVAAVFGVNASDVLTRQRGRQRANLPRKVAIYCCQQLGDMPLKTLVDMFVYSRVSSLSPAIDYVKSGLSDGSLKGVFEQVCNRLKNIKYDCPLFLFGGEYINYSVAELLEKLRIKLTKSRPRHSNDNGLVESKNGSVIRKLYGYSHIPQQYAEQFTDLNSGPLHRYLNFHHPCYFPSTVTDDKGKQHKKYRYEDRMTPYEKFRSLPRPSQYLKKGMTFKKRDEFAREMTDNEAVEIRHSARNKLFQQFHERLKTGT